MPHSLVSCCSQHLNEVTIVHQGKMTHLTLLQDNRDLTIEPVLTPVSQPDKDTFCTTNTAQLRKLLSVVRTMP